MAYPRLVIDQTILRHNIRKILDECHELDIDVVAVIKGINAMPEIIQVLIDEGITTLASSRLPQLKKVKSLHPDIQTYALRISMPSEIDELVEVADISLQSELTVIKQINDVCEEKKKTHEIMLMLELGDLREGVYNQDEIKELALTIENDLPHIHLRGVATNLGCYGSINPTDEKMNELIERADYISQLIDRPLEVISGGATTNYPLIANKTMPSGINELRIGCGFYIKDQDELLNYRMIDQEAITLEVQIVEIKDKPSYPIGEITVNAFGDKLEYVDKSIRKRAIIAVGKQDIGGHNKIISLDKQIDIIGGSSDHTLLDITDCDKHYQVGNILSFHLMYEALLMSTQSEYVELKFK